jgi:hypothetical protein
LSGKTAALVAAAALIVVAVVGYLVIGRGDGGDQKAARSSATPSSTAKPIQPAPNGGNVSQTVAPGPTGQVVVARLTKTARVDNGVDIRVLGTNVQKVKPHGPGELGGPAMVVRLEIDNESTKPVEVDGAIVTLIYGANKVAEPSASAPSSPFRGTLKRGAAGRGTYVFRVPRKSVSPSSVVVQYRAGRGVARFVP